jgi:acetoin utilization deacetylase AcuC-like enzyme
MHGEHNYPFRKEYSDLDIGLKDGTDDAEYLNLLETTINKLITSEKPDFAFYLSGADILSTDKFGKLKLTVNGCRMRDELVFSILKQNQIPCTVAMGGGYSEDIKIIVEAHCNTFRTAKAIYHLN